jgi:antitoxin Phd
MIYEEVLTMNINGKNLVSISEANQNFSRVASLVDKTGTVIILKNNVPRYVLIDYELFQQDTIATNESVDAVALRVLTRHIKAFEELAK